MKKYIDPEQQRYRFHVRSTLNGYALHVLIIDRDENIPLTPQVASQLGIVLPDNYRLQCCAMENAEKVLEQVAGLNGWTMITNDTP